MVVAVTSLNWGKVLFSISVHAYWPWSILWILPEEGSVKYWVDNLFNFKALLHHWILSDLNDKKGNATLENSTNTNYAANRYRKPFQATEFKKGYYQISNSIEIENNFSVSAWVKLDSDKQYNTLVSFADEKRENSIWVGFSRLNFHVEMSGI